MIIVDSREPRRIYEPLREEIPDLTIQTLNYGDYIIVGENFRMVIERKDVFDLMASLTDGRLWEQLKGIEKFENYKRVVLIEGSPERLMSVRKDVSMSRWVAIRASIVSGWDDMSVVQTYSVSETIMLLKYWNKKAGENKEDVSHIHSYITKGVRTPDEEMLDVLMAFSGVGGKKAVELATGSPSLYWLFKQTKEKWYKAGKIGEHIYSVLHHTYSERESNEDS